MLIFPITVTNLDVITTLNDGVQPAFEHNEHGGIDPTYFVYENDEPNRIIDHDELMRLKKDHGLKTTTRKFYFAR